MEQLRQEVGALRSFSRSAIASAELIAPQSPSGTSNVDRPQYERIGRYVVVSQLGSGGQAEVYRVIDPDLARPLVLKLARQASADDDVHRSQAVAEGRLLATLDHPGLLHVFDVGVFEGRPYLVLEYVPGRNLEQYYERSRPLPREAARLMGEVAQALAYAHSRGVIHGDVTPRNIMIDVEGHTRLIDFGLSRLEHIWHDNSGSPGGTPEFLPPELLLRDGAHRAGPAADVFGLGATFYWLLTGRGPFAAPTVVESLQRARQGDIEFRRLRDARVPRRLMRWCEAALAADPARRPTAAQSASRLRPTPRLAAVRSKAAVIIALLVALLLLEFAEWMSNKTVVLSVPDVTVTRDNVPVNLKTVLPMRTGDWITMTFLVAPGEEVTAVWLDARGKPHRLHTVRTPDEEVDRVRYPAHDRPTQVTSPEGTDMIFVCRGAPISDEKLQACFSGEAPPALPVQVFLQLQRLRTVEPMGPLPPHSPAAEEAARASEYMLEIDGLLRRHFEGVRGVAFAHRGPYDENAD
jgi:serine/threonine protein kinase